MTFHSLSTKGFFFRSKTKIWVHQEHQFNFLLRVSVFVRVKFGRWIYWFVAWASRPFYWPKSLGEFTVVVAASCGVGIFSRFFEVLLRNEGKGTFSGWKTGRIWRIWLWDPSLSMVGTVKWNMEIPPVVHFFSGHWALSLDISERFTIYFFQEKAELPKRWVTLSGNVRTYLTSSKMMFCIQQVL